MKNSLLLDFIEIAVSTLITIGTEKVISKSVDEVYVPETKKEQFIAGVGKLGLAMAIDAGVTLYLHNLLEPFRDDTESELARLKAVEEKLNRLLDERNDKNGESTVEQ